MNQQANPPAMPPSPATDHASWVPMIAIALGQAIMSFNLAALPVSRSGMVASFGVPPTTVATGIVMYSLAVAGFVMVGAKLVQRFGSAAVFRHVVLAFGAAQVAMTFAPTAQLMLLAQLLAGLAAAVNVPALVALIAHHYRGQQQATAVGAPGSAWAGAGVAAFLIGGMLSTNVLRAVADHPSLPVDLQAQMDLDSINFVSNDRLRGIISRATAPPEQVQAAIEVNTEARLRALKIGLLIMACIALLTILPASRLPNYKAEEIPRGAALRPANGMVPARTPGLGDAVPGAGRA